MFFFFSPSTAIYILAALVPAVFLLLYIYRQDKIEKEPPRLLLLLLLGGVLAIPVAILLESIGQRILDSYFFSPTTLYCLLMAFLVVAAVEEGAKLLFLWLFSWKSPHFNYLFDAVVYSVFVSLGFAAFENIKYVFTYGLSVALARAVTAVPGHLSFSVFMGIFYGRAKLCSVCGSSSKARRNLLAGYLCPVFFHGFYDACAMIEGGVSTLVFLVFVILMYILVFRLVKAASYYDRPIV